MTQLANDSTDFESKEDALDHFFLQQLGSYAREWVFGVRTGPRPMIQCTNDNQCQVPTEIGHKCVAHRLTDDTSESTVTRCMHPDAIGSSSKSHLGNFWVQSIATSEIPGADIAFEEALTALFKPFEHMI